MSFEEQFPSLKDDIIVPFRNGRQYVDIEAIQEKCLDKQRVREYITSRIMFNQQRILSLINYTRYKKID